jgi:hypothetical protein
LVVAVSAAGGFELYDSASGRLLAADPNLEMAAGTTEVSGIASQCV